MSRNLPRLKPAPSMKSLAVPQRCIYRFPTTVASACGKYELNIHLTNDSLRLLGVHVGERLVSGKGLLITLTIGQHMPTISRSPTIRQPFANHPLLVESSPAVATVSSGAPWVSGPNRGLLLGFIGILAPKLTGYQGICAFAVRLCEPNEPRKSIITWFRKFHGILVGKIWDNLA